jgi:hypothetical protein
MFIGEFAPFGEFRKDKNRAHLRPIFKNHIFLIMLIIEMILWHENQPPTDNVVMPNNNVALACLRLRL